MPSLLAPLPPANFVSKQFFDLEPPMIDLTAAGYVKFTLEACGFISVRTLQNWVFAEKHEYLPSPALVSCIPLHHLSMHSSVLSLSATIDAEHIVVFTSSGSITYARLSPHSDNVENYNMTSVQLPPVIRQANLCALNLFRHPRDRAIILACVDKGAGLFLFQLCLSSVHIIHVLFNESVENYECNLSRQELALYTNNGRLILLSLRDYTAMRYCASNGILYDYTNISSKYCDTHCALLTTTNKVVLFNYTSKIFKEIYQFKEGVQIKYFYLLPCARYVAIIDKRSDHILQIHSLHEKRCVHRVKLHSGILDIHIDRAQQEIYSIDGSLMCRLTTY